MVGRGLTLAAVVVLLDQLSKWWVLRLLLPRAPHERMIEFTPFFNLVLVSNRGVSFGLFNDGNEATNALIFTAIAAVIVVCLVVWLTRTRDALLTVAIGLVIGGAIGNVIDRLRLGWVVDFLDFHAAGWHWPAFNVADSAIVVGVGLMLLDGLRGRQETTS